VKEVIVPIEVVSWPVGVSPAALAGHAGGFPPSNVIAGWPVAPFRAAGVVEPSGCELPPVSVSACDDACQEDQARTSTPDLLPRGV